MDFRFTSEQQQFRDAVRGFAERHLAQGALERAHAERFPDDVARLLADQGLLGITVDEVDGGQGGTLLDAVIAIETVASVCPRSADVVQAGNFGPVRVLAEYASADQKRRYLAPLLAGEAIIAVAMTEPEAGSAVTDLATTAVADGDGYRLSGSKVFTSHGPYADFFLVYVRYGEGVGGIGSVIVERGAEGLSFGQTVRFMSGERWAQIYLEGVPVAAGDVLLGPGGFKRQMAGFNVERIGNASRSLALGQLAFDVACEHATQRRQFGRALCEFQGIQWKFAEMKLKLEAARLLLYRAASNADRGLPSPQETALAKMACNLAGFEVASEAVQVLGAAGYSEDSIVEYCLRRTRGWMIAGGSIEMLKNRIAEGVFGRRFSQRPR